MRVWWPITIYQCSSMCASYDSLVIHYYLSMYQYVNLLCEFGDSLLFINVAVCAPPMRVWWPITIYQCSIVRLLWESGDPLLFINVAVCELPMTVWWSITIYQCSSMCASYESLVTHYYLSMWHCAPLWESGDPLLFINVAVCVPPMRVWWPITIYQCSIVRLLWESGDPLLFINVAVCELPMRVWWPITIYQCNIVSLLWESGDPLLFINVALWASYESLVTHYYLSM